MTGKAVLRDTSRLPRGLRAVTRGRPRRFPGSRGGVWPSQLRLRRGSQGHSLGAHSFTASRNGTCLSDSALLGEGQEAIAAPVDSSAHGAEDTLIHCHVCLKFVFPLCLWRSSLHFLPKLRSNWLPEPPNIENPPELDTYQRCLRMPRPVKPATFKRPRNKTRQISACNAMSVISADSLCSALPRGRLLDGSVPALFVRTLSPSKAGLL